MTYKEQLASPKWQMRRLEIFKRDNFTCQFCRDTETELHVHHNKYKPGKKAWEAEDDDLITVCKWCHIFLEKIKKEYPEYKILGYTASIPDNEREDVTYLISIYNKSENYYAAWVVNANKSDASFNSSATIVEGTLLSTIETINEHKSRKTIQNEG